MNTTCPELMTDSQLARVLRVGVRWLRAEAEAGRLPAVKTDRRFLFNRSAVERVLADRAAQTALVREVATDDR